MEKPPKWERGSTIKSLTFGQPGPKLRDRKHILTALGGFLPGFMDVRIQEIVGCITPRAEGVKSYRCFAGLTASLQLCHSIAKGYILKYDKIWRTLRRQNVANQMVTSVGYR